MQDIGSKLNFFRIFSLIGGILIFAFGFVFSTSSAVVTHSWSLRVIVGSAFFLYVAATYLSATVRTYAQSLFYALLYLVSIWHLYGTYVNDFSFVHILTFMMLLSACGVGFTTVRALGGYMAFMTVGLVLVAFLVANPQVSPLFSIISVITVDLFIYYALRSRLQTMEDLGENETLLSQLNTKLEERVADRTAALETASEALRASEAKFRMLFESSHDAIMVLDGEGFLDCNDAALTLLGIKSRDQFCSLHPADISPPNQPNGENSLTLANKYIEQALATGNLFFEWIHQRADSTVFPAEVNLSAMELDGKPFLQAVVRDITQRKQAEEALRLSEERFAKAFHATPDSITITRLKDGKFVEVNEGFEHIFGYSREEVIGRTTTELALWGPEDRAQMIDIFKREGRVRDLEAHILSNSGVQRVCIVSAELIDIDEEPHLVAVTRDVTERKRAEEAKRVMLEQLQTFMDYSPAVIFMKDIEGRYLNINQRCEALYDVNKEDFIGKTDYDLFPIELAEAYREDDRAVLSSGEMRATEWTIPSQGTHYTYLDHKFPIKDANGEIYGICGIAIDITERQQAKEALHELNAELEQRIAERTLALSKANELLTEEIAERKQAEDTLTWQTLMLRRSQELAHVGHWRVTLPDGHLEWSDEVFKIHGVDRATFDLNVENAIKAYHPKDRDWVAKKVEAAIAEGEGFEFEMRIVRPDGEVRDVFSRGECSFDEQGKASAIFGVFMDITERKQVGKELAKSEERLQLAAEGASVGLWDIDLVADTIWVAPQFWAILGYDEGELPQALEEWEKRIHPDEHDRVIAAFWDHVQQDTPYDIEYRLQGKQGDYVWVQARAKTIRAADGTPLRVAGSINDITKLKKAEEALLEREQRLQLALDAAEAGTFHLDLSNNHNEWDARSLEIYGVKAEDFGESYEDWAQRVHPEDLPEAENFYQNILAAGNTFDVDFRIIRPDGELRFVHANGLIDRTEQGEPTRVFGVHFDVTEQKIAEQALQAAEAQFRSLVEQSLTGIYIIQDGGFTYVNPTMEAIFGYTQEELTTSMTVSDLVSDEDRELVAQNIRKRIEKGIKDVRYTFRGRRKEGQIIHVEVHGTASQYQGRPAVIGTLLDITERKLAEEELEQYAHELEDSKHALEKQSAELANMVHQLEEARFNAEEATRAKSEFLANMSHEIRTPMNGVLGMTSLLLDTELDTEQHEFVHVIRNSGETLLALINDILDFSKIEADKIELEEQAFEVHTVIEEALDLVRAKASEKGLELAYYVDAEVPDAVQGDVTRVRQVLTNLLSNAVKFTEKGEISVTVEAQPADGDCHEVRFAVNDTGIGIPKDRMDRLFGSFSQVDASTTRKYGGTGLGLVISKCLTRLMGGTLWVESEEGVGSIFHFSILVPAASTPSSHTEGGSIAHLEGKRILIVDDNAVNRRMLMLQTERWGMRPEAVHSGPAALALINQGVRFDVALLDMQMPEMDGMQLAHALSAHSQTASIPLVMLSSMGQGASLVKTPLAAWLTKPVKQDWLFKKLTQILAPASVREHSREKPVAFDMTMANRLPLRILLAEDNVVNQKVMQQFLARLGYRADMVANGYEVLDALKRSRYDVVLMDVQMPEMDGLEATRQITAAYSVEVCPRIIAITANATQQDQQQCLDAGMHDYLSKPVHIEALVEALQRCKPINGKSQLGAAMPTVNGELSVRMEQGWHPFSIDTLRQNLGGDLELAHTILEIFLDDSPDLIATMQKALQAKTWTDLERAAHTLKSNARMLGAEALDTLCATIEGHARQGEVGEAEPLVTEVDRQYDEVRSVILAYLHKAA